MDDLGAEEYVGRCSQSFVLHSFIGSLEGLFPKDVLRAIWKERFTREMEGQHARREEGFGGWLGEFGQHERRKQNFFFFVKMSTPKETKEI